MVNPNPVPPNFRVVELSAWENALKIRLCFVLGMPIPVSETVKCRMTSSFLWDFSSTETSISPFEVNFRALLKRLSRIWRSLPGSPMTSYEILGGTRQASSNPLLWAWNAIEETVLLTISAKLKFTASNSILLASIFEMSRMSLIMVSKDSPEALIALRYSFCSEVIPQCY